VHRKIVKRMLASKPAFVIATGDYVDRGDNEAAWKIFGDIVQPLKKAVPFYAAIGNHDIEREGKGFYEKYLGRETNTGQLRYYSFNYGNSHFIILDSTNLDDAQMQWLAADLKTSERGFTHRFVTFHYPLYTLMPKRVEAAEKVRQRLQATLAAAKPCGVFLGHDHYFYLTKRDGTTYVTTGGGGAPLYDQDTSLTQPGDKWLKIHHFVRVTVSSQRADADIRSVEGKVREKISLCSH
jgi:predicted phosphodiesterase